MVSFLYNSGLGTKLILFEIFITIESSYDIFINHANQC